MHTQAIVLIYTPTFRACSQKTSGMDFPTISGGGITRTASEKEIQISIESRQWSLRRNGKHVGARMSDGLASDYSIVIFVQIPVHELGMLERVMTSAPRRIDHVENSSSIVCVYLLDGQNEFLTTFEECRRKIERFLEVYGVPLKDLVSRSSESSISIDVGHFSNAENVAKTYSLSPSLIRALDLCAVSLDITVYKSDGA